MEIGNWVMRDEPDTRWHIVESIVAGDAITRCGLRMQPQIMDGIELLVETERATGQADNCKRCDNESAGFRSRVAEA